MNSSTIFSKGNYEWKNWYAEYSRSGMALKGREFKKFYGKLWIDKSNYALVKEDWLSFRKTTATYILIDNVIYPKEIKAAVHQQTIKK